ncbi:transcriptional regulator, LysR family [Rhizobiales bacterium GAS191]|jgi:DNA-binding transcriptional LysR family regulator|nr:transcriptional regulator, LysR family [Rhizobiales bacterium GAS113]SED98269.1 transcriptional regulator, LysR family [Rhizobiales bacterium GAS191]
MTLEQLRIFVAVADREHLTRAAAALNLTPSAVSSSVRALEDRYGAQLFHRVGRRIELTETGRIFRSEARATLSRAEAAELTLAELGGLKRGTLAIEASQTIASYWLPPVLVQFRDAHPRIDIRLAVGNTQSVARAVIDGAAELGFVEGEIDEPALSVELVDADRLIIVVAPDHPWADGRRVEAADLAAASWIMREPGSGTRSAFENAVRARGVAPESLRIVLELPSNESVRSAVESGPFVSVMSKLVAAAYLDAGRLVAVPFELAPRAFTMLRHKERHRSRASLALQQIMRDRR